MHYFKHFQTIMRHKYLVGKGCFAVGLYRQGIFHDMSKFSPEEFLAGAKYFQGTRSPNDAQREENGYSAAWLHHKGRNKHHFEYWTDYNKHAGPGIVVPVPMPDKYVAEMIMDRIAASKVYGGKNYTDADPLNYFLKGASKKLIHEDTKAKLLKYLTMLAQEGEKQTFSAIKKELVKHKKI